MTLQRMSDQSKIAFTNKEEPVKQSAASLNTEAKADRPISPIAAKKLNNADVINVRGSSGILSAGGGSIKDDRGSTKYMGSETNNSIWDSEVLQKLHGSASNQDRIIAERNAIDEARKGIRQESMDNMIEAIESTENRKDASVYSLTGGENTSYRASENNLSIFDTGVFDNMPEQTLGEKIAENARKPKEKDDSWRHNYGTKKMSSCIDSLFENLQDNKNNE